uniref:Hsp90 co-chaperone Cdc37 n=1 Tax=Lynx canadensis TaxID=61383 RepID=A0A667HRK3_LYNCA
MVDYSVWDHIEVSDDEDEMHPKIDTASLFCWRHQMCRCFKTPSARWTAPMLSTTCSPASTLASGSPTPSPARPRRGRRQALGTPC